MGQRQQHEMEGHGYNLINQSENIVSSGSQASTLNSTLNTDSPASTLKPEDGDDKGGMRQRGKA